MKKNMLISALTLINIIIASSSFAADVQPNVIISNIKQTEPVMIGELRTDEPTGEINISEQCKTGGSIKIVRNITTGTIKGQTTAYQPDFKVGMPINQVKYDTLNKPHIFTDTVKWSPCQHISKGKATWIVRNNQKIQNIPSDNTALWLNKSMVTGSNFTVGALKPTLTKTFIFNLTPAQITARRVSLHEQATSAVIELKIELF
jgi:hypothetical protein